MTRGTQSALTKIAPTWIIFLTVLFTYAYFPVDPSCNGWSRIDLVRALVEDRTTRIDRFQENTCDKSYFNGHYYSDKAPGTSFLAVPAYALYYGWLKATLGDSATRALDEPSFRGVYVYLCTLAAVAIPSALSVTLFFVVANELVRDRRKALFATAAYGLGSLAFPYSVLFFGHQLSGALLFISFCFLLLERRRANVLQQPWRQSCLLLAGLAAGWATLTDFTAGVPVCILGLYLASLAPYRRVLPAFCLGGLLPAALLVTYNWVSFGSPSSIGYAHVVNAEMAQGMGQGFMGITYPKLGLIVEIVIGFHRGLLPLSPVLILSGIGLWRMWLQRSVRPELVACASIVAFYLTLNSSYFLWDGGWALGPRHVVPMLAFLCLPIAFGLGRRPHFAIALLAISIANMLAGATFDPIVPQNVGNTLFDYLYPGVVAALTGRPSPGDLTMDLGMRLGLHHHRESLLLLIVVWFGAAALLLMQRNNQKD